MFNFANKLLNTVLGNEENQQQQQQQQPQQGGAGFAGMMNMGGNLGGTLSPSLTPYLAQHYGWNSALYVMGALSLLGALLWLGVHPAREIDFDTAPR